MKILIIDDDADIVERLQRVLTHRGFEVVAAHTGAEGLAKLLKAEPQVVLLDLLLPDMHGLEVLKEIKRLSPESSVIIISAFAGVGDAVKAVKQGASNILVKPFHTEELVTTIRKTLEEAKLEHRFEAAVDSEIIKALSNPVRREVVLRLYSTETCRFSSLVKSLNLNIEDAPKLSYHLRVLKKAGIVAKTGMGDYCLTPQGRKIVKKLILNSEAEQ